APIALSIAALKAMDLSEHIECAVRSCKAKNRLTLQPSPVVRHGPPLGFRAAPCSSEPFQGAVEPCKIFLAIPNPNVHVKGQFRQVPNQEVHPSDQQIINSLSV